MEDPSISQWLILAFLVSLSAIFSGLTIGYMSLDKSDLQRKRKLGNKDAAKVLKLRKNVNLLLCTLLLGNVTVNIAIPLYLDKLMVSVVESYIYPALETISFIPEFVMKILSVSFIAGGISVISILVFGEIIPQAVTARHALKIGAFFSPLMRFVIYLFWIICFPMSKLLDWILGTEGPTLFRREEFAEIIKEHEENDASDIDEDEERIILGALSFSKKTAKDIMRPKRQMFFLDIDDKLDEKMLNLIKEKGFTRIPVFEEFEDNIVGILSAKKLIGVDGNSGKTIRDFVQKDKLFTTKTTEHLDYLLNKMSRRTHMALVYDETKTLRGVLTLEDIIEKIIDLEIIDETDKVTDLKKDLEKIPLPGQEL